MINFLAAAVINNVQSLLYGTRTPVKEQRTSVLYDSMFFYVTLISYESKTNRNQRQLMQFHVAFPFAYFVLLNRRLSFISLTEFQLVECTEKNGKLYNNNSYGRKHLQKSETTDCNHTSIFRVCVLFAFAGSQLLLPVFAVVTRCFFFGGILIWCLHILCALRTSVIAPVCKWSRFNFNDTNLAIFSECVYIFRFAFSL